MINTKKLEEVGESALSVFGPENQLTKLIDECTELSIEASHARSGQNNFNKLAEEMADVLFTIEQAKMYMDKKTHGNFSRLVIAALNYKVERTDINIDIKKGVLGGEKDDKR